MQAFPTIAWPAFAFATPLPRLALVGPAVWLVNGGRKVEVEVLAELIVTDSFLVGGEG